MNNINPFRPHNPVSAAMFAGRVNEVNAFEKALYQTKNRNPINFLITGDRGIGKTSLLVLYRSLARGDIKTAYGKLNFIIVNTVISPRTKLLTLINIIDSNLKREIGIIESASFLNNDNFELDRRVQVLDSGSKQGFSIADTDLVIDEFVYSLSEICNRIENPEKGEQVKDGIVIFIDEADNSSSDLHLGYFLKSVTEMLQQYDCGTVMFVVAGLPDVSVKLSSSHPSSLRIFNQLKIQELSTEDTESLIDHGIKEGNKINVKEITISSEAKQQISALSEGCPHFIQQFSYSAFEANVDGEISEDDVLSGAFHIGGGLDSIGNLYYAAQFHEQIKSDEYREVLSIMAENRNSWNKKSDIRKVFTGNSYMLKDALKVLVTCKFILKNPSEMDEYRLHKRGFALWIKFFGNRIQ